MLDADSNDAGDADDDDAVDDAEEDEDYYDDAADDKDVTEYIVFAPSNASCLTLQRSASSAPIMPARERSAGATRAKSASWARATDAAAWIERRAVSVSITMRVLGDFRR